MAENTLSFQGALKLDEDLDSLKQQIRGLKCQDQSGIEQVKTRVETVQAQVKQLLEEIGKLEDEKMALEERVVNLENTVESLKKENVNLRDAVKTLKKKNETLKEREKNLEAEVEILKTQVNQLLAEISNSEGEKLVLEERVANLEDTVESLKEGNVNLQSKVTSLTNKVAQLTVSDDELLLGQLCWRIQSMIFKKVLPPSEYNKNVGYSLGYIEGDIDALGKDEDIKRSKQAWATLQHELRLSEWDVKRLAIAMRNTQSQRNVTAHPELNEEKLLESAKRMNGKGELKTSYENITKLIGLWETLEKME